MLFNCFSRLSSEYYLVYTLGFCKLNTLGCQMEKKDKHGLSREEILNVCDRHTYTVFRRVNLNGWNLESIFM